VLGAPGPHAVGDPTARARRLDGLEQFLLGGAVSDGTAHVSLHAVLEAMGRQDAEDHQFFHFDRERALRARAVA